MVTVSIHSHCFGLQKQACWLHNKTCVLIILSRLAFRFRVSVRVRVRARVMVMVRVRVRVKLQVGRLEYGLWSGQSAAMPSGDPLGLNGYSVVWWSSSST